MRPKRPKPTRHQSETTAAGDDAGERLQKVLAAAGLGSRRKCEELITQGRVEVDRQVVSELGAKVHPLTQEIRVDGEVLRKPKAQYFLVNKPEGVLSTSYDQQQRARVIDLVNTNERLFTVGRLDQYSEGLILVTNDGELANRLTHPRYGAEKTYVVLAAGEITPETLLKLKKGVHLAEGVAKVASLKIRKAMRHSTELEMVLQEGKNRELRRILAAVGHKVMKLKRTQLGPLKLGELPVGAHRPLTRDELEELNAYAYGSRPKKKERPEGTTPLSTKAKYAAKKATKVAEHDEELDDDIGAGGAADEGPILVNDELTHFDDRSFFNDPLRNRAPGAVLSYEDDAPPPVKKTDVVSATDDRRFPDAEAEPPRRQKKMAKPRGRFAATKKTAGGKFPSGPQGAKPAGRGDYAGGDRGSRGSAVKGSGGKASGAKGAQRPGDRGGAARKFSKKFAKKKGRR